MIVHINQGHHAAVRRIHQRPVQQVDKLLADVHFSLAVSFSTLPSVNDTSSLFYVRFITR
jgi:hypothetical protein